MVNDTIQSDYVSYAMGTCTFNTADGKLIVSRTYPEGIVVSDVENGNLFDRSFLTPKESGTYTIVFNNIQVQSPRQLLADSRLPQLGFTQIAVSDISYWTAPHSDASGVVISYTEEICQVINRRAQIICLLLGSSCLAAFILACICATQLSNKGVMH